MRQTTPYCDTAEQAVDQIIERVGKKLIVGIPLALGKPNQLINALYQRAKDSIDIQLDIFTALSLEKPAPQNDIEARFLNPLVERLFGDYEELEYMRAIREGTLPDNIRVSEFYFKAGAMQKVKSAQRHYISTNYTFVARDMIDNGVNVLLQLVAAREMGGTVVLSLACNTDITLDLMPMLRNEQSNGRPFIAVAQIHDDLPFMRNNAIVASDYFDLLVHNPAYNTTLFAPPNVSVSPQDYLTGLYASALIRDGGTLQIGIGSLGDAIVYGCQLRHQHNEIYRNILNRLNFNDAFIDSIGGDKPFAQGLYGASEMFVNGFMHLIESGILKRKVYDDLALQTLLNEGRLTEPLHEKTLQVLLEVNVISSPLRESDVAFLKHWGILAESIEWSEHTISYQDRHFSTDLTTPENLKNITTHCLGKHLKHGIYMHGGFFLGPRDFYQALRELTEQQANSICMSSVGHINQLDFNPPLYKAQRQHARFINTGMMVTLGGAVVSDGLQDGTVISGVGGQYNFVAMAHALPGARSILCIRSTRGSGKKLKSNIVPFYGHVTVPRHLRDIIVTEYGVADLRSKNDEQIIQALLNVADSRFQDELLVFAVEHGKLEANYQIPEEYRNNLPENVVTEIRFWREKGYFPAFPLGTDFTREEIAIGKSLKEIKALMNTPARFAKKVIQSFLNEVDEEEAQHFLHRMQLEHPHTARETLIQHLLLQELEENGYLRPI